MSIAEITPDENLFIEKIKIGLKMLIQLAIFDRIKTP